MRVALLGLGVMGAGMAGNLLKHGHTLTVYNRTTTKAAPLAAQGAHVASIPREAAESAEVIIAMVGDDRASRAIWLGDDGALAGARSGTVLVECSTLSLGWVRELGIAAAERDLALLDSPVTGSKDAAEAGELRLFVGGEAAALERARPALEAISREAIYLGPTGSGALMKLVNNMLGATQVAVLAEGLLLAERGGLDMEKVLPLLLNGTPGSPIVRSKAVRIANRDYGKTQFALRWMHKDTTYALLAADEYGVPVPTLAAAREVYQLARNRGFDDADQASRCSSRTTSCPSSCTPGSSC